MDNISDEDITRPFRLILGSVAAAKIRDGIPQATPAERAGLGAPFASLVEAGGLLMGESIGENAFRVMDVSVTIGEPHCFYRDQTEHQPFLNEFYERFPDRYRYNLIGDWHSHPSGNLTPSTRDFQSLRETMATPSFEASFHVMLIVCLGADMRLEAEGVVLIQNPNLLNKIIVTIEPDRTV